MNPINLLVSYLFIAIIVSAVISLYAWRNTKTHGSRAFMATSLISIIWIIGDMVVALSSTFEGKWVGSNIRLLGIVLMPVALLVFSYQYCGRTVNSGRIVLLLIVPAISWITAITNPLHHLFFKSVEMGSGIPLKIQFGLYFWAIHMPYCYGLLLITSATVMSEFTRASRNHRKQILILFCSLWIPSVINIIGVLKLLGDVSYTPLSFPVFFVIVAFAVFRYQFLGSNLIAYESVFQTIRDGVLILDQNDIIRDINPSAAKGLNKEIENVVGLPVRDAFSDWNSAIELYDANPTELGEIEVELFGTSRFLSIESTPMTKSGGAAEGRIITIRDITDRHKHQLSLEALAFHDPLTRLANRRKFQEEVDLAIRKSDQNYESVAILYFDLNHFKAINDTYGHETGDELLKYVAARIASITRKPDLFARLGGDEFALLLHDCDEKGIGNVVERILENVKRPLEVGENTLIPDLSIGAAFYPDHGTNLAELLRHADKAMYLAKQNGGGFAMMPQKIDVTAGLEM